MQANVNLMTTALPAADPEGERTDVYRAAITSTASSTSSTTDNLENIALARIIASVVPTEDSEPEISPRDRSGKHYFIQ